MKDLITFNFNQIGIVHNLTLDEIAKLPSFPDFSNRESYETGVQVQNSLFDFHNDEVKYPDFSEIKP